MTLTLRRGDQLLGELLPSGEGRESSDRSGEELLSFSAFLVPAADAAPFEGVWQVTPSLPGFGVLQYPVEPEIVGERRRRLLPSHGSSGLVPLPPVSPDVSMGVPPTQQFVVHDPAGRVYRPAQLRLQESRLGAAADVDVLRNLPAGAIMNGGVWTVLLFFASTREAPSTGR